ncbi:MAG: DUF427 domain-containing protein [Streptosporangiales bacterium]|nr:DUF427 domain-containing protein [Streptosporangiales bacterium]
MTVRARWNGVVLAESDETRMVEGNHYFPPASVRQECLAKTRLHTVCPWKGVASYYTVTVDGVSNKNAAWYYPRPFPLARKIKNYVAFHGDVEIVEMGES